MTLSRKLHNKDQRCNYLYGNIPIGEELICLLDIKSRRFEETECPEQFEHRS